MRKLAAVLLGCLLLTGCAASWQQELPYKIIAVDNSTPTEFFDLELVGDAPNGSLEPEKLKRKSMQTSEVEGARVGDVLLCVAEQKKGNAFGDSNVVTSLQSCKKA
ncbi:hypothetical protein SK571_06995 [Lentzea sp. BCCO 10_0798]|jgi:hypothetical protein|uniref:DUF4156 domain-containing protein n=1 Tax=Lentzea kristufekii TaxID=3095430 RepID=A0ABU4TLG0_9PSEU|nr:hypothetical protein [Lentzea sp. BCCO 10_0798]MDX8049121.1 hypothetical protein [Lentzea sp. BCCO 10_0798]